MWTTAYTYNTSAPIKPSKKTSLNIYIFFFLIQFYKCCGKIIKGKLIDSLSSPGAPDNYFNVFLKLLSAPTWSPIHVFSSLLRNQIWSVQTYYMLNIQLPYEFNKIGENHYIGIKYTNNTFLTRKKCVL